MIYPSQGRLLVVLDEAEQTSPGGIILPGAEEIRADRGVVLRVGHGVNEDYVGRRVVFNRYDAVEIEETGHVIIKIGAVIGYYD